MEQEVVLEFLQKSEKAALFTIHFKNDNESEFTKFMLKYRGDAKLNKDYQRIIFAVSKCLEVGVLERFFRPEGKVKDNVCALPIESGKLRLYCLRLSDKILIIGNGGVKATKTYNENAELSGYVLTLQKFDEILRMELKKGTITIEQMEIAGYDDKIYKL